MHQSFTSLEDLFAHMKEDKEWTGANVGQYNRYPMRFVLFDNFADFYQFVADRPIGVYKYSINTMLDDENPDQFLSYTELSKDIRAFAKMIPINDFIIFPFSEMARFYNNDTYKEFDSLVTTIRGQEAPQDAQEAHVRLYIPIVGMQGKMGKFMNDNATFVWEYKSGNDKGTYNLVLTNGTTYGVSGLDERYTLVNNLNEWLRLWEQGGDVKQTIICSSPNIYANAHHAKPDNAFTYTECHNAYEFLTKALHFDFGVTKEPSNEEMQYWELLASEIDITTFNFEEFVKERVDTHNLEDSYNYIKSWFDCDTDFDRWLLTLYFHKISSPNDYVYRAVSQCATLSKSELFSNIATLIFDDQDKDLSIADRKKVMKLAADKSVKITDQAAEKLKAKLQAMACSPEQGGYYQAVKLLTPLTEGELQLCIEWLAKGKITVADIKDVFPELYHYMEPMTLNSLDTSTQWITKYFDVYRRSKIANFIDPQIDALISEKNANVAAHMAWVDNFKTVKTVLHNRKDIDVIYWVDGLGVDWIPFIRDIVARYSKEHVYLNEVYVASAKRPTTTSVNKAVLQSLLPEGTELPKTGDIDSFAHKAKVYPQYIIDEMAMVEKAISDVLEDYNGKKIAFVSDHGLTYLSQLVEGLKIGGLKPDHEGRLATYTGTLVNDSKYIKLDDDKTVCALTHRSLIDKVDKGHGAHGGCTPEEVLVPIIIVSSQKNANNYSAQLENDEIDGTNPVLRFVIKGLSAMDVPTLIYNGVTYQLMMKGNNIFESERLNLVDTATKVNLCINGQSYTTFNIKVSTGATEDDLFNF